MTELSPDSPLDSEMADLVSRYLDERLDPAQRKRLDERLRDEPAALEYCASQLRFAAALRQTLEPQRLEMLETRRMVIEPGLRGPEWSVEQQRTVRYGSGRADALPSPATNGAGGRFGTHLWRWGVFFSLILLASLVVAGWLRMENDIVAPAVADSTAELDSRVVLRNPDFEATDLSLAARGITSTLVDWQEPYPVTLAELCEIGRVTNGRIFAKSGKNVVHMQNMGYITQQLRRNDGGRLRATTSLKVRLSGWYYVDGVPFSHLKSSLTFIASPRPDTIRYQAGKQMVKLPAGGWQHFTMEVSMKGENLMREPLFTAGAVTNKPSLDLTGRELHLMIERRDMLSEGDLYLDDLQFEVISE